MINIFNTNAIRATLRDFALWIAAAVLLLSASAPIIFQGTADAATLTSRSVTISTSQPSATGVSYDFDFTFPTTSVAQSLALTFCTTPLGTCTLPTGMNVDFNTTSISAQTWEEATNFAEYSGADAGACTDHDSAGASTQYCATRTDADTEDTATAKSITIAGIVNPSIPSGNNTSVYIRVAIYTDTAFATAAHDGTVAASIVNQLTVTGRVQERLVFCTFALDDADGSNTTVGSQAAHLPSNCAAGSSTESSNVDVGVVDNLSVARSPVDNNPPTALGNDRFGAAMVNTNASQGVSVAYYATAASTGTNELRAFRVTGASCNGTQPDFTDQCFRSASDNANAGTTISAGVENFGMQIVCISNSGSQSGNTPEAAGDLSTTSNLGSAGNGTGSGATFRTAYANGDTTLANIQDAAGDNCENTEVGNLYAWNDTSTAQAIVGSTTVVDDELIKLRFGASANATTPTGTYTVASTFIATATF
jgi:hypothetical protein